MKSEWTEVTEINSRRQIPVNRLRFQTKYSVSKLNISGIIPFFAIGLNLWRLRYRLGDKSHTKATSITVDPSNLTPESIAAFQQAQEGLSSALSRLMVTVERYPDLKANQNFMDLQHQLEGTENRIALERRRFNEVTREYNTSIRRFPASIVANSKDFEKKGYFEALAGSETAPVVEF